MSNQRRIESDRWERKGNDWFTAIGLKADNQTKDLLDEIFMLRWELDSLASKINEVVAREVIA